MATKSYRVLRSAAGPGVRVTAGTEVKLEPHAAAALGACVEEVKPKAAPKAKPKKAASKKTDA